MDLLERSFFASMIILVVILCRAFFINRLPKKIFLILWYIVLFRLLIPYSFPSTFSIYSLIEQNLIINRKGYRNIKDEKAYEKKSQEIQKIEEVKGRIKGLNKNFIKENRKWYRNFWKTIWFIGMIICTTMVLITYILCYRKFSISFPVENRITKEWLRTHKIKRHISIKQIGGILSPLTYGIIRPVILMPKEMKWENTSQIQYILEHEFVHIKRWDAITKLCFTVSVCIYWFHPLVWVMYLLVNRDIELSCDEAVVRHFGEDCRASYALTLIAMEEVKNNILPFGSGFNKSAAKERITSIMKTKKISFLSNALAIILILSIFLFFAASPIEREKSENIIFSKTVNKSSYSNISTEENKTKVDTIQEEYDSVLGEIVIEIVEEGDYEALDGIINFLSEQDLNKVIKRIIEKGDYEKLKYMYPYSYIYKKEK